jgi:hypothetical protein
MVPIRTLRLLETKAREYFGRSLLVRSRFLFVSSQHLRGPILRVLDCDRFVTPCVCVCLSRADRSMMTRQDVQEILRIQPRCAAALKSELPVLVRLAFEVHQSPEGVPCSPAEVDQGYCRVDQTVLFAGTSSNMDSRIANSPNRGSSLLTDKILLLVRKSEPDRQGWEERLREPLNDLLVARFEPGDIITSVYLNSVESRLALIETMLKRMSTDHGTGPSSSKLESGPKQ